jgi:hypothetical protein
MPPSRLTLLLPLPLRLLVLLLLPLRLLVLLLLPLLLPSRRRKSRRSNSVSPSKEPAFGLAFFCCLKLQRHFNAVTVIHIFCG